MRPNKAGLVESKLKIPKSLYDYLMPHQRQSLSWFWRLHQEPNGGGILGDDMVFIAVLFISVLISKHRV